MHLGRVDAALNIDAQALADKLLKHSEHTNGIPLDGPVYDEVACPDVVLAPGLALQASGDALSAATRLLGLSSGSPAPGALDSCD